MESPSDTVTVSSVVGTISRQWRRTGNHSIFIFCITKKIFPKIFWVVGKKIRQIRSKIMIG